MACILLIFWCSFKLYLMPYLSRLHTYIFSALLLFTVLGLPHIAYSQDDPDLRPWNTGPLTWSEFQGHPETHDHMHGAVTYAGIALEIENVDFWGNMTFKAYAVFDRKKSWTRKNMNDRKLLAHEQVHFDIAEVYARRLQKKLNDMGLKRKDAKKAKRLHHKYNSEQLKVQAVYDEETIHGISEPVQAQWRELVNQGLIDLDKALELSAKQ